MRSIRNKKSATLIELVILILVVSIIGATMAGAIIFFTQLFLFSPRQLDTQKIAQELSVIIFEGNQDIRGIRYSRSIIDATETQFSYIYGYPSPDEQLSVRFRWDATDKHIYRSISTDDGLNWSAETVIPYYIGPAITIDGKDVSGVIFTYKKANDIDWIPEVDDLTSIRRLVFGINIKTGTGSFSALQGSSNFSSSVEVKNFQ